MRLLRSRLDIYAVNRYSISAVAALMMFRRALARLNDMMLLCGKAAGRTKTCRMDVHIWYGV